MVTSDKTKNAVSAAQSAGILNPDKIIALKDLQTEIVCSRVLLKAVRRLILSRKYSQLSLSLPKIYEKPNSEISHFLPEEKKEDDYDDTDFNSKVPQNLLHRNATRVDLNINSLLSNSFDPHGLDYTVVIDRKTFNIALNDNECRKLLVCLLACAKSVVFSELMPRDKGDVVRLIRENIDYKPLVAAVGNGEGDIHMLQQADIGIGISNNKDSLAMNYSDIKISSFTNLTELLLLQGHYNYSRISKSILLFIYKNCLLSIVILGYTFLCSYSGTSIFNASLLIGYNIFFTSLPVFIIGVHDEYISDQKVLNHPQVYTLGIKNDMLNAKTMIMHLAVSVVQGVILIILVYVCLPMIVTTNGYAEDYITLGSTAYITTIVAVLLQIYIETYCYSLWYYLSLIFSIVFLVIFISIESNTNFPDSNLYGLGTILTKSPIYLLSMVFTS